MPSLKEIRKRIQSVNSTMQITSAMKMVAAAKLKRSQDAISNLRPYANKMKEVLGRASANLPAAQNGLTAVRPLKKVLLIAITSNRGLCGAFNNNVIKQTQNLRVQYQADGLEVQVLALGKKAYDAFAKMGVLAQITTDLPYLIYDNFSFQKVSGVADNLAKHFMANHFDRVVLVHNSFKNAVTQVINTQQYLPILPVVDSSLLSANSDYIFEPSAVQILDTLLPKLLRVQLYSAILDSLAAEHAARMTAMHNATDNAKSLKKGLTIAYNKARQAAITREISEIVAGSEAQA
jgi:F-type H+-transporting ATPase subunit gamma